MSSPKTDLNPSELNNELENLNAKLFIAKRTLDILEGGLQDAEASADNPGPLFNPEDYEDIIQSLTLQIAELKQDIAQDEARRIRL